MNNCNGSQREGNCSCISLECNFKTPLQNDKLAALKCHGHQSCTGRFSVKIPMQTSAVIIPFQPVCLTFRIRLVSREGCSFFGFIDRISKIVLRSCSRQVYKRTAEAWLDACHCSSHDSAGCHAPAKKCVVLDPF
mmetsp:Transcript_8350/g.16703  ORF Transcript_8350/g.16703 Transcript_8350/m.16703 type:complete len:135 (-) Transcript_8350:50-454(-)